LFGYKLLLKFNNGTIDTWLNVILHLFGYKLLLKFSVHLTFVRTLYFN
jgi:uncharacterized membrane protein YqaE (UPF0057 family)